jgi:S-(hydroxymethyl)glutathione dehydrogenase/alcohol dehydrogenase
MIAAVLEQCKRPLALMEFDIPLLRSGQVLVEISYSAICRSQLMEINGLRGHDKWLPHMLGHEASGTVVDVGSGVTKVKPGDQVILTWIKSAGIDAEPAVYHKNGRTINAGPITTFSNYSIVSENRVVLKPRGLGMDIAVLFGCALATGSGMVINELALSSADSVVVLGLGGVGLAALLALRAKGVTNVVGVDNDPSKCSFAASIGAEVVMANHNEELAAILESRLPGGADYCIEAGGTTESIEMGFSVIKPMSGTLLFASHPPSGKHIQLDPHELIKGKRILGTWGGKFKPDQDIPRLHQLLTKAKAPLAPLTNKKYPLVDINLAVRHFDRGEIFRPILDMAYAGG